MPAKHSDPRIKLAVSRWPEDVRYEFEERAAIIEYDGGVPRMFAEREAYNSVLMSHPVP